MSAHAFSSRRWLAPALLGALLACGGDRTHAVAPHLEPPGDADFGVVPVLNEKVLSIPLLNLGRSPLLIEDVHVAEAGAPFTLGELPTEVGLSETGIIDVKFVPPAEKAYQATLVLQTTDPDNPLLELKLFGTGSTRAVMAVSPAQLEFGRVAECGSSLETLTISASGSADLILEEIFFAPGTAPGFSFVGSVKTPATVRSGHSISLTVKYSAAAGTTGPVTGAVHLRGTDPDHRELLIPLSAEPNRAPVPQIKPLGNAAPGQDVTLDATLSTDPDGDLPLTYKWTLRGKPLGSHTTLTNPTSDVGTITLDPALPGEYEVQLDVTDAAGAKACAPARAKVVARPAQKLLVEMFWNNAQTDIDLHLLRTPTSQVGAAPDDCFYSNPAPNWGVAGAADDPSFLRDALTGYGPEVIGYVDPVKTTFTVVAEFVNAHLSATPATEVTVRVYVYGELKKEFKRTLEKEGDFWPVADVTWDSGVIVERP